MSDKLINKTFCCEGYTYRVDSLYDVDTYYCTCLQEPSYKKYLFTESFIKERLFSKYEIK